MPKNCPACGARLPETAADVSDRLCAACLMRAALELSALPESPAAVGAMEGLVVAETEGLSFRPSEDLSEVGDSIGEFVPQEDLESPDGIPAGAPREFGSYRLVRLLGRGGMGVVYEAEQVESGRRVALKMLSTQLGAPEVRARFFREGRLAAGVSHPNSVYVFGTEEIEGLPVITMEVVGGGTLQDRLDRVGRLSVTEAVDAMLDLIDGLEAALSKDVLHRDIKPTNCFIGPDGKVKIGDFGLSVSTITTVDTFATATGVALGTPAFAAPEQLRGDPLDRRADIYSIGATLHNLLTGTPPFRGNNAVQIVAAVLDETPASIGAVRPDVTPEIDAVVSRCLAKRPADRFPDYASLRAALLPFSSRRPDPVAATRMRRILAGTIDLTLAWTLPRTLLAASVGALSFAELWWTRWQWPFFGVACLGYLTYFAGFEGRGEASPGKWLLGLSVRRDDHRSVGYAFSPKVPPK